MNNTNPFKANLFTTTRVCSGLDELVKHLHPTQERLYDSLYSLLITRCSGKSSALHDTCKNILTMVEK
ncbi:hypothetical protein E2C01_044994 [Portunus trituberculatus]|uniref:Uncharacterized protein n=1 Tax=Portunus trituberculatus TaxID=210409 RepID=A0A5B7G3U9_PORTR|nr:hypothetical protein [Portunus trituberculatus]